MIITLNVPEYITPKYKQLTLNDFLLGLGSLDPNQFVPPQKVMNLKTFEHEDNESLRKYFNKQNFAQMPTFPNWNPEEAREHYDCFHIPKKTGGLREIWAPEEDLKDFLRQCKYYFEYRLMMLPNDAAHAYVAGRSTITNNKVHVKNESNWYLKIDMKDFFPSHSVEYMMNTFKQIYPTYYLLQNEEYKEAFEKMLKYATVDNKLIQGSPLAPTLTNILMAPIDYAINKMLKTENKNLIYTRYADDIIISSKYKFDYKDIVNKIKKILERHNTPFSIKDEKTRFGSTSGRNWNLGIMINKDNEMTIGYRENKRFKAMLFNLIMDKGAWPNEDKATLAGKISYYKAVQPDKTNRIISDYERDYNVRIKDLLKV